MPKFDGFFETGRETRFFDVELKAGVKYIIDVVGTTSAYGRPSDPVLRLFDGPFLVLENDDSGPLRNPQMVLRPVVTETYTFEVESLNRDRGGFTLNVFQDDFRYHPYGVAPAGDLESGGESRGKINYVGDTDIHEVWLVRGLTYDIEAKGVASDSGSLADPEIRLRNFNGLTIAADNSDAGRGADDLFEFTPRYSDLYYVDVSASGEGTGSYETTVSAGRGTHAADRIQGSFGDDAINARGGNDRVDGYYGDDVVFGRQGRDELFGGYGDDELVGGKGADGLTGGAGADVFSFGSGESTSRHRDVIRHGNEGAFSAPGARRGDLIDLSAIDANALTDGDQAFRFGTSKGVGRVWVEEEGDRTIVKANIDDDARAEFEVAISDRSVRADAYTEADFIL